MRAKVNAKPIRELKAHARTKMIHGAFRSRHWEYNHHVVPPITSSATFRLDSVERGAHGFQDFAHQSASAEPPIYIYDRLDEPTRGMLEENLAQAEGGDVALCFSSGMAAISATVCTLVGAGDHVVTHDVLYGCTYSLFTSGLPRFDVDFSFVDLTDPSQLRDAVRPQTRLVYFETPVNPDLTLIDIQAVHDVVAELNRQRGNDDPIRIVVDNTFATPYCQRPLELGADVVCHSLTKGIGGFGTDVGGAVIAPEELHNKLLMYRKDFGGVLSPKAAWATLVYGLPSLGARMSNYQKTAMHVAKFLEHHAKVEKVFYPGLPSFPQPELARRQMQDTKGRFCPGSMIYFVLRDSKGSHQHADCFVDYLAHNGYAISLAVSLGQVKTLIECPFSMTHSTLPADVKRRLGIVPGGIRLSCGLEDWEDIVGDLRDALAAGYAPTATNR